MWNNIAILVAWILFGVIGAIRCITAEKDFTPTDVPWAILLTILAPMPWALLMVDWCAENQKILFKRRISKAEKAHLESIENHAQKAKQAQKIDFYQLGMQAFKAGIPESANPGTKDMNRALNSQFTNWQSGWLRAQEVARQSQVALRPMTPFDRGVQAYAMGYPAKANPWTAIGEPNCAENFEWARGWAHGEQLLGRVSS